MLVVIFNSPDLLREKKLFSFTESTGRPKNLFQILLLYSLYVHYMFTVCSLYVHCIVYTLYVHYMLTIYSLNGQYIFTICSLYIHYMFTIYIHYIHYMFTICSLYVHYMFTTCSLYVHYMFTICSLYVHYMFTICSLYEWLLNRSPVPAMVLKTIDQACLWSKCNRSALWRHITGTCHRLRRLCRKQSNNVTRHDKTPVKSPLL